MIYLHIDYGMNYRQEKQKRLIQQHACLKVLTSYQIRRNRCCDICFFQVRCIVQSSKSALIKYWTLKNPAQEGSLFKYTWEMTYCILVKKSGLEDYKIHIEKLRLFAAKLNVAYSRRASQKQLIKFVFQDIFKTLKNQVCYSCHQTHSSVFHLRLLLRMLCWQKRSFRAKNVSTLWYAPFTIFRFIETLL